MKRPSAKRRVAASQLKTAASQPATVIKRPAARDAATQTALNTRPSSAAPPVLDTTAPTAEAPAATGEPQVDGAGDGATGGTTAPDDGAGPTPAAEHRPLLFLMEDGARMSTKGKSRGE